LYATWTTKGKFLKIYAGGGADVVFETDGPISMPLFEAGISIKPFMLIDHSEKQFDNSVFYRSEQYNPLRRNNNKVKE